MRLTALELNKRPKRRANETAEIEFMQESGAKRSGNGVSASKSPKAHFGTSRKNGYVHVISPATLSAIRKWVGIEKSHMATVLRAFADAGAKI